MYDSDDIQFARPGDKWLEDNEIGLLEIFNRLEVDHTEVIIVVEGMRDECVLRQLGVTRPILRVHQGWSLHEFIEHIANIVTENSEVLILTDFDSKGQELGTYIDHQLEVRRIRTLRRLRTEISRFMANMTTIEELSSIVKKRESIRPLRQRE